MNPHAGKTRIRPDLVATTRAARETAAVEAFGLDKVRALMVDASKAGLNSCLVGPKRNLNLKGTKAAAALILWLEEEGFQHGWEARTLIDARPGADTVFDLLVTWRL